MANNIAFQPMGKTVRVVANSATANNVSITADSPSNQYRMSNHAAQPIYVWLSPSESPVNVAAPTGAGANSSYAICIPPGTNSVITGPQCSATKTVQISVISETNGPEVYITPGEGL